ncbi:MAG: hypothetical protein ACI9DF_003183 [Verrucomicrobiales bacterium]|jgi:hypothetical protein
MPRPCHSRLLILSLSLCGVVHAQEGDPTALALETMRQWLETEQLISEEKSAWEVEKSHMQDLLKLYGQEITSSRALVGKAGGVETESVDKRAALVNEEVQLQQAAARVARLLGQVERSLLQMVTALPSPLKESIASETERLSQRDGGRRAQERLRDVLSVLSAADKFQKTIHLDREIRTVEGGMEVEVRVLYLGLGRAFYADESGAHAGIGLPSRKGWVWQSRPELASTVAEAVEILETNPEKARFLDFPFQVNTLEAQP